MKSNKARNLPELREFLPRTCKSAPSGNQSHISHFSKITKSSNRDQLKLSDSSLNSSVSIDEDEMAAMQEQVDGLREHMDQRFQQLEN